MNEILDVLPTEQTDLIKEQDEQTEALMEPENKLEPILEPEPESENKLDTISESENKLDTIPESENKLDTTPDSIPESEITKIPINRSNSQDVRDFISKYGNLQKKNSLLIKGRKKRFDSADYFEAKAKIKKPINK